ncbi:TRAF-type zinc finger domain-containing protein 1-like [Sipha flava]|uniref:TRAF-type zinc finger domain-containing protein 1 n=1 Tax=Sipha flava TaxID=143950 RepID=A0A2S2PX63_9HEMI|nr:TRAF-type zinc finger domain-containing protein 1-like [Sipha flava]
MNPSENKEDIKYCFNCRRNIPISNHVMHIAYCHRNLKLCIKCDEPFLTSEFEEHQKTMHADIFCDACAEKLEALDLELHKLHDCPYRLVTCNFCEIDLKASMLPAHIDMCSSRTERCNDCGQFIMLKFIDVHKESHKLKKIPIVAKPILDNSPESLAAYPPLIKKVSKIALDETARATTRATSMPSLRLSGPIMTNHRVSSPAKHNNDQPQINTLNNNDNTHKDPKQNMSIVDITNDDDEFSILGAHSIHNNQSPNINNVSTNEYNHYSDELRGVQLPCEFCQKMIDSENLVLHETGCRPDLVTFHNVLRTKNKCTNNQNDNFPVPPLDLDSSSSDSEINLNTLSLSSDDDDNSDKTNVEKLPCEFCEELISIKKLINHQIRCEKIHSDLSIVNNLDEEVFLPPSDSLPSNFPNSAIIESNRNLFKQTSANQYDRTLMYPDAYAQSPASSTYESCTAPMLPRVKLNKQISNKQLWTDNCYVNSSARNNYEQFLSNSRLNRPELTLERNNSHLFLNPSGGAIPKQNNSKANCNKRVINNLSKRRDSNSSSD